ncbi:succinate dehydrogenase iron-sulfur subunit, partial [Streptomyces sp. SID11233]|nr:succinate dehydrogenase iron-sulfur subunit [Streptomyces sp. SID11233]
MTTAIMDKVEEAGAASGHLITVTVRVRRFNPEVSADVVWQDFQLPMDPKERVLDALHKIKWEQDG